MFNPFRKLAHTMVNPPIDRPAKRLGIGSGEVLRPMAAVTPQKQAKTRMVAKVSPYEDNLIAQNKGLLTPQDFVQTGYRGDPLGGGF